MSSEPGSYGDGEVLVHGAVASRNGAAAIIKDAAIAGEESAEKQRLSSELLSERNDAIWEELASPDHPHRHRHSLSGLHSHHHHLAQEAEGDGVLQSSAARAPPSPEEAPSSHTLLLREDEDGSGPRHRRPLSDHLLESHDFSFCPEAIASEKLPEKQSSIASPSLVLASAQPQPAALLPDGLDLLSSSPSPSPSASPSTATAASSESSSLRKPPSVSELAAMAELSAHANKAEDHHIEEKRADQNLAQVQNDPTQSAPPCNGAGGGGGGGGGGRPAKEEASPSSHGSLQRIPNPIAELVQRHRDQILKPAKNGSLQEDGAQQAGNNLPPSPPPPPPPPLLLPEHSSANEEEEGEESMEAADKEGRRIAGAVKAFLHTRAFVKKARTRSRLIEVSVQVPPLMPSLSSASIGAGTPRKRSLSRKDAASASSSEHQNQNQNQNQNQRSISNAEDDEDPFKDVDADSQSFRRGNCKPLTLLQWASFFVILGGLICSLTLEPIKRKKAYGLRLWKWFLTVLVLFSGRLVSGWLIRAFILAIERNFLLRKKLLYFVYGLRRGVQNCLWLGLVLLAWKLMIDPKVESSEMSDRSRRMVAVVTDLFECIVVGAFIWLVKLLLVKSLASSFHVSAFFDRIQELVSNQHVLETLSGPPFRPLRVPDSPLPPRDEENPSSPRPLPPRTPRPSLPNRASALSSKLSQKSAASAIGLAKKDRTSTPAAIVSGNASSSSGSGHSSHWDKVRVKYLRKLSAKDVSAGMITKLMSVVKHPGFRAVVTTIDEEIEDEQQKIRSTEEVDIDSELQAKVAAKLIFRNVAQPDSRFITREDLFKFFEEDEINNVMCLFEGARDTNKITKKALKNWVVKMYQERRSLAHSLNDTKTAVKELHRMASVIVSIIIIIVWLLMLGIASTQLLVFAGSQLLLVGFMFGNTVKQIFEAIIFLFVMHPYDVGDRCIIDGVHLIVEEMKILTTVFLKPDNEKVYYPNSVLATKAISNLYRSPEMRDVLEFAVHISISTEQINALKEKIARYVEKKSQHWQPKFTVTVTALEVMDKIKLSVTMQHTINFQNFGDRMSRRSELLLELKRCFAELGIEYHLLPQRVHILSPYPPPSQFGGYPYPPPAEFAGAHAGGH